MYHIFFLNMDSLGAMPLWSTALSWPCVARRVTSPDLGHYEVSVRDTCFCSGIVECCGEFPSGLLGLKAVVPFCWHCRFPSLISSFHAFHFFSG